MAAEEVVFTIMIILAVGIVLFVNVSRLHIPYTVLMFIFGCVLGAVRGFVSEDYYEYFDLLVDIPPHLIFHLFLPILIFEGSFGMKIHALNQVFWQVIILAGPGLLINTLFVAFFLNWVLGWGWYISFLLGSLLSATDPVAVVALLKGLGVDKRITAMVDGEAIMNDGTAIICFTIFFPAAKTGSMGTLDALIIQCFQLTLGAVAFGVLCGWLEVQALKCTTQPMARTCITVAGSYLAFFIADEFLATSGVLTICFEGIFLSTYYPSMFPGKEGNMFRDVWDFLVHMANTVIFAMVGLIIVRDVIVQFAWYKLTYIVMLYIVLVVARYLMILMQLPILNRFSFKLQQRDLLLLTHAGLRGAVAATMALIVSLEKLIDRERRFDCLAFTAGIILITTLVNATTSDFVVIKLGHRSKEANRLIQMDMAHKLLTLSLSRLLRHQRHLAHFQRANFPVLAHALKEIENPYSVMLCNSEPEDRILNVILMRIMKVHVWTKRDNGMIPEDVVRHLATELSLCMRRGIRISTKFLQRRLKYPPYFAFFEYFPFMAETVKKWKTEEDAVFLNIYLTYAGALDTVEQVLGAYVQSPEQFSSTRKWIEDERHAVNACITQWINEKPDTATSVVSKTAGLGIVREAMEVVEELREERGLSLQPTESLKAVLEGKIEEIEELPDDLSPAAADQVLHMSMLGKDLSDVTITAIVQMSEVKVFEEGSRVHLQKASGVVLEGVIEDLEIEDHSVGAAGTFGVDEIFVTRTKPRRLRASTFLRVLAVPHEELKKLAASDPALMEALWRVVGTKVSEELLHEESQFVGWKYDHLLDMCAAGRLVMATHQDFTYTPQSSEIVVFLHGNDASGLLSDISPACVMPRCLSLQYGVSTALWVIQVRVDEENIGGAIEHPTALTVPHGDEEMSEVVMSPAESAQQKARTIEFPKSLPPPNYNLSQSATRLMLLNMYQLAFLREAESLTVAVELAAEKPVPTKNLERIVQFLNHFCLDCFAAEGRTASGQQGALRSMGRAPGGAPGVLIEGLCVGG